MNERRKRGSFGGWLFLGLIGVALVVVIAMMLWGKEEYTSGEGERMSVGLLSCLASDIDGAFFVPEAASELTHEIRTTFIGGKVEDFSYIFDAKFSSMEDAESAMAIMHGKYNKYLGEKKFNAESLNPVFSSMEDNLKITLFASRNKINEITAKLFFLGDLEVEELDNYNGSRLKRIYESRGFSCIYKE